MTRGTLYILLPLCLSMPLCCSCSRACRRTFSAYTDVTTLEGAAQTIAQGPVASQEAIKMLGTNGGGFFNANCAHPFENPTPLANLLQMFSDLSDPRRPDLHVRQDGRQHQAGLGAVRGDERSCSLRACCVCYEREAEGQSRQRRSRRMS